MMYVACDCNHHVDRVILTDKDECATESHCEGGICSNHIAKEVADKGFSCRCFAGFATIVFDQVCSGQPLDDITTQHENSCSGS